MEIVMKYIKENWKFLVFTIIVCIIGAYYATLYSLEYLDPSVVEEGIKKLGSRELLIIFSVVQVSIYSIILGGIGIILANKVGLWKKFYYDKKGIIKVIIISIIGGLLLSIIDRFVFGSLIEPVLHSFDHKPTINYIIMCFTYGGVFEEVLMRLFLMTLFSWIIAKLFYKKEKEVPVKVFMIANIISALLFAAGHLPSTNMLFGYLDGLVILRCFLLNGAFGLAFGFLYQKFGIGYAMLAHFGCHLISKLIWLLFI